MKKISKIIWGALLIVCGVLFALNAFDITHFNIFFDGWWALFIIVPCFIGLFTEKDKWGNLFGILIGVLLLLCARDILSFSTLWKIIIPFIIIRIGIRIIVGATKKERSAQPKISGDMKRTTAVFSGSEINFAGKIFEGATLSAVFGGIECDLRGALIEKDCVINAAAVFGGIDITVPDTVNIEVNGSSIFGGVSELKHNPHIEGAPTIYINAGCAFGGVDIK